MGSKNEAKVTFTAETTKFNEGIKKANSEMTMLRSEMRLNEAQFKNTGDSSTYLEQKQKLLQSQLAANQEKQEALNGKLKEAKKFYGEDSVEVQKLETQLVNAKVAEEGIRTQLDLTNAELAENIAKQKEDQTAAEKLTSDIQSQEEELKALKTEYVNVTLEQGNNSTEAQGLKQKISELNGELEENKGKLSAAEKEADELGREIKEAGQEAEQASNGGFTVFKGIVSDLASAGLKQLASGIKNTVKSVVTTGAEFEASMSKVKSIAGATEEEFQSLKETAREMGATTKFTASESAEAMNYMAMAGWEADQMIDGLPGILNLAAAAGEDLATTSDIVTDGLTAFGMEAKEAGHFADVLAVASAGANTNVSMMGESFKYVAPVAGALDMSVEDTSVALGLMANSGIKASQAGTSLRSMLTNLSKPTDKVAAAMEQMGITLDGENGKVISLHDLMVDLRESFGNLQISTEEYNQRLAELDAGLENGTYTQKQYDDAVDDLIKSAFGAEGALKAEAAATIAGKTGMAGLLAIINTSDEDFEKLTEAVNNATDAETGYSAAAEMAGIAQDNLQGDVAIMKSAFDDLKISIFDDVNSPLRDVVQGITNDVIPAAGDAIELTKEGIAWMKENKEVVIGVAIVLGSLAAGITAYNTVTGIKTAMETANTSSLVKAAAAQIGLNTAMLASPITWIVAGITAVVAAGVLLYKNWDKIKSEGEIVWGGIKLMWKDGTDWVTGKIEGIGNVIMGIPKTFEAMQDKVEFKVTEFKSNIENKFLGLRDGVKEIVDGIKGFFDFTFNVPKIKLPHFGITPQGWKLSDLLEGSIPKLGIEWYAKGAVLNRPTVFGLNGYNAMIGGEAGKEAIAPIDVLQDYVRGAVAEYLEYIPVIDYEKLGNAVAKAVAENPTSIMLNNRELGRAIREVM